MKYDADFCIIISCFKPPPLIQKMKRYDSYIGNKEIMNKSFPGNQRRLHGSLDALIESERRHFRSCFSRL